MEVVCSVFDGLSSVALVLGDAVLESRRGRARVLIVGRIPVGFRFVFGCRFGFSLYTGGVRDSRPGPPTQDVGRQVETLALRSSTSDVAHRTSDGLLSVTTFISDFNSRTGAHRKGSLFLRLTLKSEVGHGRSENTLKLSGLRMTFDLKETRIVHVFHRQFPPNFCRSMS